MKYAFTVFLCKIFCLALRLTGHNGTSAPGKLAIRLCPDILARFASKTKKGIIAVLGTNGKTTTNNIIADCLEEAGNRVVCNRVGANMDEGVAGAYLEKCGLFGSLDADWACLEMDEGWAEFVLKFITPTHIVVTNLFRDQLDRYGETETTMEFLRRAIRLAPSAELILNGDDPITVFMAEQLPNHKVYFGIENKFKDDTDEIKEGKLCYNCGRHLHYEFRHFSQLGGYSCECGFARPALSCSAENISVFPAVRFDIKEKGELSFSGRGIHNVYNVLCCALACEACGISFGTVKSALLKYKPQAGRMERFTICGRDIYLILAKNPAGFNRSVASVAEDPSEKEIIISVNDGIGDGRDVSWLWDVDFEKVITPQTICFGVAGTRYADVGLRLKYADAECRRVLVVGDFKEYVKNILRGDTGVIYIIANYTAVFGIQTSLKELRSEYGA